MGVRRDGVRRDGVRRAGEWRVDERQTVARMINALPPRPRPPSSPSYPDFTAQWYASVGSSLLTTMIINCAAPHAYPLACACLFWHQTSNPALMKPTQAELNEAMVGPFADWATRYAQVYTTLFVCFIFAAGIPLMVPVAAATFIGFYAVDKALFVWYYRKPVVFGIKLQKAMTNFVPAAIVLHLAFGVWMISGVPAFST